MSMHVVRQAGEVHWALDPDGWVTSGHVGERFYRFGLDGSVLERSGPRWRGRVPRRLARPEADALLSRVAADVASEGLPVKTLDDWAHRRSLFERTYRPVRVLPPDNYRAVVVQLVEGCSHDGCTFCTLYRGVPFRVKSARDLEAHLMGIRLLLGHDLERRTRVFLGGANPLLASGRRLVDAMERSRRVLGRPAEQGFDAFTDLFTGRPRDADLVAARNAGLRRVYVGLETGDAELLARLNKPGGPAQSVARIEQLKAAGLEVGVIVLVGAGGPSWADRHFEATVDVIGRMALDSSDAIYLSPIVPSEFDVDLQVRRFEAAFRPMPPRITPYDIRRWIY